MLPACSLCSLLISLLALPALGLGTLIPWVAKCAASRRRRRAQRIEATNGAAEPLLVPEEASSPPPRPRAKLRTQILILVGTTLSLNALLMTQAFSLLFTKARDASWVS